MSDLSRVLKDKFFSDLFERTGILHPILQAVRADDDLSLLIRDNYIDIYYLGLKVIEIKSSHVGYTGHMDENYLYTSAKDEIKSITDSHNIVKTFGARKSAIKQKPNPKNEKKYQQALCNANSRGDFIVVDMELRLPKTVAQALYPNKKHLPQIDMVGLIRNENNKYKPVFIENKYKNKCVSGHCGLAEHTHDYCTFIKSDYCRDYIKNALSIQTRQLSELGLITVPNDFEIDCNTPAEFLAIIIDSDAVSHTILTDMKNILETNNWRDIPVGIKYFGASDDLRYTSTPYNKIQ